jgi:hypothetical protein
MTESCLTQQIKPRKQFQRPKGGAASMVLSALLATQMFIADAHAESTPSVMVAANLKSPTYSPGAAQKNQQVDKQKSSDMTAERKSCWQYQLKAGRWKRTNVCFSKGR